MESRMYLSAWRMFLGSLLSMKRRKKGTVAEIHP
jgi:hypothetical protein